MWGWCGRDEDGVECEVGRSTYRSKKRVAVNFRHFSDNVRGHVRHNNICRNKICIILSDSLKIRIRGQTVPFQ